MDLVAFVRDMRAAARPEEPIEQEPLSQVRWTPAALQKARAIQAARRPTVHVGNPIWRKRPAARRRADLDGDCDAWVGPQILSRTHSKRATRKGMPTGAALCQSDRASGWHQHSGMMPSGRLSTWQCWRLCRQT